MHSLIGDEKVLNTLAFSGDMRVVDPACGTGGFLVYLMQSAVEQAHQWHKQGKINAGRRNELVDKIKQNVFFGADAHDGVASSAKMNMIIAGDGHSNIQCEDSLAAASTVWNVNSPDIDLIITNPPFGTSETESMLEADLVQFPKGGAKGQIRFLQKMIQSLKPGGEICTVIDEGLLNTEQATTLREYILESMIVRGIVRLPDTTFKPNKINVKSSVLHLVKRHDTNADLDDEYPVLFLDVRTLGYHGFGDPVRGFDFGALLSKVSDEYHGSGRDAIGAAGSGDGWRWLTRSSLDLASDATKRFDFKYWDTELTDKIDAMKQAGAPTVKVLNLVKTKRGKSPNATLYVDEQDGYALVVKAGSNITRYGKSS